MALLAVIAGVFVLNALATARRALSAVDVEDEAIAVRGPWPARLRWDEVHRLRLAHYSTRRDGSGGWMQLTLAGRGRRLVVDSRIGGFDLLARRAVAAARRGRVRLDEATIANFRALGIEADAPGARPGAAAMTELLRVRDLQVAFHTQAGVVTALDGLSFRLRAGSAVALVGESGSGKSVTAQAILGLLPRTGRITGGEILLDDPDAPGSVIDLAKLDPDSRAFRAVRGDHISMIFQEPMSSLSPLHTVGDQVSEALFLHRPMSRAEGRAVTIEMLRLVGFPDPERAYGAYPFEFSGGLRQRAMIAMALICRPAILIADEPSTALDVTIQAQILKLIVDLQGELGMALLLITHDLGVVANVAEEVVVMYRGRVMESGTLEDIYANPGHPYLKALLRAVPHFDMKPNERLVPLREIPHHQGHLLAPRHGAARRRARRAAARGAQPHQDLRHPRPLGPVRRRRRGPGHRGRRRQLLHPPRPLPRPRRRKRLRQDHGQQDCHARHRRRRRSGGV